MTINEKSFISAYGEAVEYFHSFASNSDFDITKLETAADKFAQVTAITKDRPEPYFYLGYIFLFLDEPDLAQKCYKTASTLDPELPGLNMLKENIKSFKN